jgi:hypothetical protein
MVTTHPPVELVPVSLYPVVKRPAREADHSPPTSVEVNKVFVGFEVLITSIVIDIVIFWDTALCSPYVNRRFGGTYHFHSQGHKSAGQESSE